MFLLFFESGALLRSDAFLALEWNSYSYLRFSLEIVSLLGLGYLLLDLKLSLLSLLLLFEVQISPECLGVLTEMILLDHIAPAVEVVGMRALVYLSNSIPSRSFDITV